jgi:long-chain acyl-CoA synthetase
MHGFAALLAGQGVGPGDRVGLQSENRPEWSVAYMGILQAGAVVVPLDAQLKSGEVGEILSTSGARLCVVSARQAAVLEEVRAARLPSLQLVSLDPAHTIWRC